MKDSKKIAVIMGGYSAERQVSLDSGQGVLDALKSKGYNAIAFDFAERNIAELADEGVTHAFITAHGRFGEDGCLQGALELLGIPYTGSGVLASAIAMNKEKTKRIWQTEGLSTPAFKMLNSSSSWESVVQELGLPLIVKPAREGSSFGLSKVTAYEHIKPAFELAAQLDAAVMAETCIEGDELTCALLDMPNGEVRALPLIRIVPKTGSFDYESKYVRNDTEYHVPSGLDPQLEKDIQSLAIGAYRSIGCRGWGRVDVMLNRQHQPFLLEINTAPGMTSHSLVPMAAKAAGIDYPSLVEHVLLSARNDHHRTA